MIEIIPISKRTDKDVDTPNRFYIEDSVADSIAKKYNYAIENIILPGNDPFVCFRHYDTLLVTPYDIINYKLEKLFSDEKLGICGLIGTIALDRVCTWWNGVLSAGGRATYGSGSIIQGGKDENGKLIEYPMNDHPGVHNYLATVDGCCMFIHKRIFERGIRFDNNLQGYHFYDTDICLQLLEKGYRVSTIDVTVKHFSEGRPPKNFNDLRNVFFQKWNKKVHGEWPISRLSKFYE